MTNEMKQEFTRKISQANKSEMIVLVYDIALAYINESKELLMNQEWEEYKMSVRKAQNCISDLIGSLNLNYEISYQLMPLYTFVNRELIHAVIRRKEEHLLHAEKILTSLQEAFREISSQDQSSAMMGNAQSVVAGLTYGRNTLTESLQDQGSSRGFRV